MPRFQYIAVALVAVFLIFRSSPARAVTRAWSAGDGNWSQQLNWSPIGVPGAGDTANILNTDGVSHTITYDYTGGAVTLNFLSVDLTGGMPTDTEILSMAANNLTSAFEYVGWSGAGSNGSGTFNQSGGVNTINGTAVYLGLNPTDNGYYNLSGTGSLVAAGNTGEIVGYSGTGNFTQNGGSNSITVAAGGGGLILGNNSNSVGSYTLNRGTLTMGNNATYEVVANGAGSTGTFVQNGGVHTTTGNIFIANGNNSTGSYTLAGGSLSAAAEFVGNTGTGSFTQTGGTNTANGGILLGYNVGSMGTYTLTGGSLSSAAGEYVGDLGGVGVFIQSGGSNTTAANINIYLGNAGVGASSGDYELSGTGALTCGDNEFVGYGAAGTFNQTGGTNTVTNILFLASTNGLTGTYSLSGTGVLVAHTSETIGQSGSGVFNQSGGFNTTGAMFVGLNAGSTGTFTLSGGTTTVTGALDVGLDVNNVAGVLNVTGGVLNIGGTLTASVTPGTSISLNGGTINAAALNFKGNPSVLAWTSGTLDITTNLTLDSTAGATSTSAALGPALTLGAGQTFMVTGNEAIGGAGSYALTLGSGSAHVVTGTLTLTSAGVIVQNDGSTLNAANFVQAGGEVDGTLQNQGSFNYQSGPFNGRLLNQGSVNLGPNFTAGNGIENDTSMTIASGQVVAVNGAGLDNLGSFALNGGTISGAGPVKNDFGATLTGFGTINPPLVNNGLVKVAGVLRVNGGATNAGFISGGGNLSGGLTNAAGGIVDANNPGGPLALSSFQGNAAGATVEVAAGCLLDIANAWTNSGIVILQGNDAVLNGAAITSKGTIQGIGIVNAPIVNMGTIEPLGSTLIAGGAIQNTASGLIRIGVNNKLIVSAGLPVNAGIVSLTGGTFDNNGHPLNNSGQVSGWGTLATGGTGLDNNGSITFSGGLTTVNGPVSNENGQTIVVAYNPAIFTGLVTNNGSGTFNIINTTAVFAGGSSGAFGGTFTNNAASAFAEGGSGAIEVDGAPTLGSSSSLAVNDTSTLRFKATAGTATIGAGVTATVNNSAMLELAGSVSALGNGSNRVTITNNSSAAAGILVTGTRQIVGNIDGSGTTQVNAGSDLTANHIVQSALVIGGTAGNPAIVTIDASDSSGNPLAVPSGFVVANLLTPSGPFGAGETSSESLSSVGEGVDVAAVSFGNSIGGDRSPVPEPSTLLLAFLAVLGVVSTQFVRRHLRSQTV
jgi:fibronectin-binding autotransporter adhesin